MVDAPHSETSFDDGRNQITTIWQKVSSLLDYFLPEDSSGEPTNLQHQAFKQPLTEL